MKSKKQHTSNVPRAAKQFNEAASKFYSLEKKLIDTHNQLAAINREMVDCVNKIPDTYMVFEYEQHLYALPKPLINESKKEYKQRTMLSDHEVKMVYEVIENEFAEKNRN